jgi:ATP/maltotriose-dependent transcriptional regulator MalT
MAAGKLGSFDNFKNLGEDFIGRKNELAEIRSYFSKKPNRMPRVLIIHALAGQGKTQIALEYCRQSQEIYGGIFWLNATSDMTVIGSFEKIATELQLASSETLSNAAVMIRTVKDHLESWKERWLMVLDNYDRPEDYPDTKRLIPSRTCYLTLHILSFSNLSLQVVAEMSFSRVVISG